jgi:hypothetical protein
MRHSSARRCNQRVRGPWAGLTDLSRSRATTEARSPGVAPPPRCARSGAPPSVGALGARTGDPHVRPRRRPRAAGPRRGDSDAVAALHRLDPSWSSAPARPMGSAVGARRRRSIASIRGEAALRRARWQRGWREAPALHRLDPSRSSAPARPMTARLARGAVPALHRLDPSWSSAPARPMGSAVGARRRRSIASIRGEAALRRARWQRGWREAPALHRLDPSRSSAPARPMTARLARGAAPALQPRPVLEQRSGPSDDSAPGAWSGAGAPPPRSEVELLRRAR